MEHLRPLVLERLMLYHRYLAEARSRRALTNVTSAQIAEALDIDPTQVRKDLGSIGLRGRGRVGFDAAAVADAVRHVLGFDRTNLAIVVGAGHLGGALIAYGGFARYGLRIVAAFDSDPAKTGKELAGCPIRHTRGMRAFITKYRIRLAILATPAEGAQKVADRLVSAGIKAIWNFAPTRLALPKGVAVRDEHISLGLAQLAHYLTD
ncbi:MAG: redox-sensing transcriptional repressor Rex [Gemmatimonadetes bacterium]|nr:redox-sensing transcriptional repressor Rex [Gemmatimonadota bacterium]